MARPLTSCVARRVLRAEPLALALAEKKEPPKDKKKPEEPPVAQQAVALLDVLQPLVDRTLRKMRQDKALSAQEEGLQVLEKLGAEDRQAALDQGAAAQVAVALQQHPKQLPLHKQACRSVDALTNFPGINGAAQALNYVAPRHPHSCCKKPL